jgi:hypothetical protein
MHVYMVGRHLERSVLVVRTWLRVSSCFLAGEARGYTPVHSNKKLADE